MVVKTVCLTVITGSVDPGEQVESVSVLRTRRFEVLPHEAALEYSVKRTV